MRKKTRFPWQLCPAEASSTMDGGMDGDFWNNGAAIELIS